MRGTLRFLRRFHVYHFNYLRYNGQALTHNLVSRWYQRWRRRHRHLYDTLREATCTLLRNSAGQSAIWCA